jgi:predicted nucleic acid-binding protein
VGGLEWLPQLFDSVFLPESVKQEVLPGKAVRGDAAIAHSIEVGWIKVWSEPIEPLLDIDLDAGETDCINIGLSHANKVLSMNELDAQWLRKKSCELSVRRQ